MMKHEDDEADLATAPSPVQAEPGLLENAPWWLISSGLHIVLLLGATLIFVERLMSVDGEGIRISGPSFTPQAFVAPEHREPGLEDRNERIPSDTYDPDKEFVPVVIDPTAKYDDHFESDDGIKDQDTRRGDSLDARGYIPGSSFSPKGRAAGGEGQYDTLGVGNGAGGPGRFGRPDGGGNENLLKRPNTGGMTEATQNAVLAALKWLAHHQSADGSWKSEGFSACCTGAKCSGPGYADHEVGVTGLSLLAFLGAGYTHLSRDEFDDPIEPGRKLRFGQVVRNGIEWLRARQQPDGCVGAEEGNYMYEHCLGTLALCEAYGMTSIELLRGPAQKGIDFLVAAQNPGRGWRYKARAGDNDTSVTGWAVMALKSAELSGLSFPKSCYDGALVWLDEATDKSGYYRAGYNSAGSGQVVVPGKNNHFDHHESMSAVSVMCRIFIQKNKREPALGATQLLLHDLPAWQGPKIDFYYWYYASLALYQFDGPNGPMWKKWNEPMKNALVPNQKSGKDGCQNGSWAPEVDRWGFEGGRVYATAINALTLEVYYRYPNVFRGDRN